MQLIYQGQVDKYLEVGLTQNLFDLEVKKVTRINRSEHYCGISALAGASDTNNILIGVYQTTVGCHQSYLTDNLHPLTKNAQGIGNYIPNDISMKFSAHGTAESAKGVGSGKHYASLTLNYFPILLGEFLGIG